MTNEEKNIVKNNLLKKAIASEDYRKYIEDNKIVVLDWDLATLIYHNKMCTHNEILKSLSELADLTEDKELKKQICERVAQDKKFFELFKQPAENAYYQTAFSERPNLTIGVFTNFEDAYKSVTENMSSMRISRYCFDDKKDNYENEGVWGTIECSSNGQMGNLFSLWYSGKEETIDGNSRERFEGRGLDLPLMFQVGDIVYIPYEDVYGIVMAPVDDEESERMRQLARHEYDDFQVPVDYVYKKGIYQTIFHHGHVSPADMKYLKKGDDEKALGFLKYLAHGILKDTQTLTNSRSAKRMDEILGIIREIWQQYPDFRLGQLLVNACGKEDLFYVEDNELMYFLQKNKFPIED